MAGAKGIRAGRAFVELFADNRQLVRGLRMASKKLKAFGDGVRNLGLKTAAMGAAVLAPLAGAAKYFSSYGDQVAKMAKRTGLSTETLSELRFVASQTGTEFESLEMGFRRMQRSVYDAGRGMSTAVDALSDLGLTVQDLDGLSPEQQFKLLGDRIGKLTDPTKRAAIAMTLFGRTGTNLLPMFAQGAEGIEALQEQARSLGLTMSGEDAKAAEDFTDAMDALAKVVKMGIFRVGAALAPLLQQVAKALTDVAIRAGAWIQANQGFIVTAAKVAAVVVAAGAALAVLGTIISGVGAVFGGLATVLSVVLSPLGLVIAAAVALGAVLIHTSDSGGKMMEWLGSAFGWLKKAAVTALSAVVFGIKNWRAVLEYALVAGVYGIVKFASQVKHFFVEVIPAYLKWFGENWRDVFITAWNFIKTVSVNIARNLKNLWDAIVGFIKGEGWNFKWTPMLEGFENAIKELPKIAEREIGPLEKELGDRVNELGAQLKEDWQAHDAEFQAKLGDSPLAGVWKALTGDGIEIKAPDMSALADAADLGGAELSDQASKLSTRGTFNAATIQSLQVGPSRAEERTANATEAVAKYTKKLADKASQGGLTFA